MIPGLYLDVALDGEGRQHFQIGVKYRLGASPVLNRKQ